MRYLSALLILAAGCLPAMPDQPTLDVGIVVVSPDAGRTTAPPPPPPDAGPRDIGFGELSVIGLTPDKGPSTGGTRVQLRGEGFLPDTVVELGGLAVRDVLVVSSRALTFFTPAAAPGAADLRVQNSFGTAELSNAFTYFQPLQPRQIDPSEGPLEGGIEIRLTGEGLSVDTVALIGGQPLLRPRMQGDDLLGTLPAGAAPGVVDVRIADGFGQVHWRSGFRYLPRPYLERIEPNQAAPNQEQALRLLGGGLCDEPEVRVGGIQCQDVERTTQGLTCSMTTPAQEAAYAVRVICPGGSAELVPGLVVVADQGPPVLLAVVPDHGPLSGGNSVTLIGRDLSVDDVSWDGQAIAVLERVHNGLLVQAPARQAAGSVSVAAGAGGALENAYSYRDFMMLRGVEPVQGPATGGTTVTLFGQGFCAEPEVRFDGIEQEILEVDGRQIRLRTAEHPGGRASIAVVCPEQTASRHRGFLFEAALEFVGLSPNRGALAGGTEVYLVGQGFARSGLGLTLGGQLFSDVTVLSDALVRAQTPPGQSLGAVDLRLSLGQEQIVAPSAFTYYDPGFRYGGSRGGTPQGSINVTVLNSWGQLAPVEGAQVVVGGSQDDQRLVAVTDARGQATLSDPSLFGPQTVTVYKEGCDRARSLVDVDAADLTFWIGCMGPPSEGGGGGTPPPAPQPLIISGRILGFDKALFDPGRLGPNQRAFAQVHLTQSSPYGGGTWANGRDFVFEDGGEYRLVLASGRYTLVAVAGIHDSRTQQVSELTQLGFRRQVSGPPGERLVDQDIVLNYPMDATYGVSLGDRPAPLPSLPGADRMRVRVALDFGGEGYFPLADEMSRGAFILLRGLPRVQADMLYVSGGLVSGEGGYSPSSTIRTRGSGRLEGGITLGPLLPLAERLAPRSDGGLLHDRTLRWKFGTGPIQPDYIRVDIADTNGNSWELMLRGGQNKLRLPNLPNDEVGLGRPGVYFAQITAVANPRFDFDNFSYLDTWFMSWQALSERAVSFRLD